MQATIQRRFIRNFSFQASYVWSKFLDEFDSSAWGSRNGTTTYQNSNDVGANYGPSNFDVRNAFKGDAIYQLPFGRGQMFLNKNSIVDEVIGGWQLANTFVLQGGNPFTVTVPTSLSQSYAGSGNLYPNWNSNPSNVTNKSLNHWFNTTYVGQTGTALDATPAYSIPASGTFGNFHRNNIYGPGLVSYNASLGKTFSLYKERVKMQVRADATNVLNHPVFAQPNSSITNGNFGKITGTNGYVGGRNIQLGACLSF